MSRADLAERLDGNVSRRSCWCCPGLKSKKPAQSILSGLLRIT